MPDDREMTNAPEAARARRPLTIGIAFPGEFGPDAWSGSLAGLQSGMRASGAEVVRLPAGAPRHVERVLGRVPRQLPGWRAHDAMRTARLAWEVRRARRLDGILLVGSLVAVRSSLPIVTYEDMTVRQALALDDPFVTERSAAEIDAWLRRQRAIYAQAAGMCAFGRWAADSIVADYGAAPERVHVVGAGMNHVPQPAPRDWSTPRFLFVGRDFDRKDGPAVLRAFAALRGERADARLDVVGGHPPIDAQGVTGHGALSLAEPRERALVRDLFASATCFVMPSRYEPFGIVYVEAAAAGVPSIATTVGASFVDDTCGRRVPPGDDRALLEAMRALADGDVARPLGERARERSRLYTWPLVGGRLIRCFAEAAGRSVQGLPDYL